MIYVIIAMERSESYDVEEYSKYSFYFYSKSADSAENMTQNITYTSSDFIRLSARYRSQTLQANDRTVDDKILHLLMNRAIAMKLLVNIRLS
jgi:hypothetical protein